MDGPIHRHTRGPYLLAFLTLAVWTLGLSALTAGLVGLYLQESQWLVASLVGVLGFAPAWLVRTVEGNRVRCAVCASAVFGNQRCSKHAAAKRFLGSYNLRLAGQVLAQGKYQCPYCNERVACSERAAYRRTPRERQPRPQSGAVLARLPAIKSARRA